MNTRTQTPPKVGDPNSETRDLTTGETGGQVATVDFGDDAGKGMENIARDEYVIPFLRILQTNSPQCQPPRDGGMGATPGSLFNTATQEIYDGEKGATFIPVYRDHNFVEYTPRNLGGGFVGAHTVDAPIVLELRAKQGQFGKLYTSDKKTNQGLPAEGTEIAETFYLYGLLVDDQGFAQRAMVAFVSTQIKKYRAFVSRVDNIKYLGPDNQPVKPPLWAHRWRLTTVKEKNAKGEFYGLSIRLDAQEDGKELPVIRSLVKRSDPLYQQARDFYDLIASGGAKADYAKAAEGAAEAEGEDIPM